jgi:hypothetical protein
MQGPLYIGIKIQIPVIDSRYVNTISVEFNHIQVVAAIGIAFLVLDYDEERVW